ncbi:MAG: serine/threonine-protein phosphatase [Gallionellaceae bacterium]|nr:MAG: serine/threonine-protein phosphatase [Gallionellaceae bacterium]
MKFAVYQTSQIGGRKYNQDRVAHAYTDESLLLVLADGMGGHLHGEIAAQIAIHTFMQAFAQVAKPRVPEPEIFLRDVAKLSHHAIIRYAQENQLGGNPGTTCVAALVQDGFVNWAHAGDSRFYLLRDKTVAAVTHDHSVVQQWADWGIITHDEMKTHPDRNKITNCLGGVDEMFYVEASDRVPVQSGDVLLLCSDGLWSPLLDKEMAEVLATGALPSALGQLVEVALYREQARADNTTAVAARLGDVEEEHKADMPMCMVLDYR